MTYLTGAYFIKIGDSLSQLFNVIIFNGDPNYSISGESYRLNRKYLRIFIDFLFSAFQKEHCKSAYYNDIEKARALIKTVDES